MSDEKRYTERDMVLAQREAFLRGANHKDCADICVASCYPLPKVSRPRVVIDELGTEWRVVDGALQWKQGKLPWTGTTALGPAVFAERIPILADLLDTPTVEVEAE